SSVVLPAPGTPPTTISRGTEAGGAAGRRVFCSVARPSSATGRTGRTTGRTSGAVTWSSLRRGPGEQHRASRSTNPASTLSGHQENARTTSGPGGARTHTLCLSTSDKCSFHGVQRTKPPAVFPPTQEIL